jgi:hypothetical protein
MAVPIVTWYRSATLQIGYQARLNDFPVVSAIIFKGRNLSDQVIETIESTLTGVRQYHPFSEMVLLDSAYEKLLFEYFDEIHDLSQTNLGLSIVCTDTFFNLTCSRYWELIARNGSKNLALSFLEEICKLVDKWEMKRKGRVHKGTPYFFLTFVYREMGDIDSAFAAAFKAIREDQKSSDPLFGKGKYKEAPAYKYVTIIDDKSNFLYETVIQLRSLINTYVQEFNTKINPNFSINDLDSKFLRGNKDLENVAYIFVYTVEVIKKYLEQLHTLPANDFYKIKNLQTIFNLCLVVDKILEHKFKRTFKRNVRGRDMCISDGVVLLSAKKGWIPTLTADETRNPRALIGKISPTISDDVGKCVKDLILNPIPFNYVTLAATTPVTTEFRQMLLAHKLRNEGAHSLEKQAILVSKYKEIVEHLMFAIFIAVDAL